jgi:transcriptional regulator with XRE-family HTH domain
MSDSFDQLVKRTTTPELRKAAAERSRQILAEMLLAEVRALTGKSQTDLARVLGVKQPTLSKLEKQDDMRISTLTRIIEALGGEIEIVARFPAGEFTLNQFRKSQRKSGVRSAKRAGGAKHRRPTSRRSNHPVTA